ncbi:unnamed protein product [Musa banksii]
MDKDGYAWLSALGFAFLTYSSAVAVYRSRDDASAVTFVAVAYADLWLLFRCLRALERGGEGANNWRLRAAVWSLVTLLTSMFSYKVAAVMPWPVSVVVTTLRSLWKRRSRSLMALSCGTPIQLLCRSRGESRTTLAPRSSVSFPRDVKCRSLIRVRSSAISAPPMSGSFTPAISLTDKALNHLNTMRSERDEDLCLRIGVKQGGCSGMSYTMEFENRANTRPDDSVIEYNGFVIVCDPKSLLFLYGMLLDYSDALIGGGFSFKNPNATQTCGCGKSFAAESI